MAPFKEHWGPKSLASVNNQETRIALENYGLEFFVVGRCDSTRIKFNPYNYACLTIIAMVM